MLPKRSGNDLEGKRFYHISTDEVYGSLGAEGLQKRQHTILILLILHPKRAQITLLGLMVKRMVCLMC
jgi:hypothetical protein